MDKIDQEHAEKADKNLILTRNFAGHGKKSDNCIIRNNRINRDNDDTVPNHIIFSLFFCNIAHIY